MTERSSFLYKEEVDIDIPLWLTNFLIVYGKFLLKCLR
jgi:hypothetical protein